MKRKKIDQELIHARTIARMHTAIGKVQSFDPNKRLMVLSQIHITNELMTYSGKILIKGKDIKLGFDGFFICFDEETRAYKLFLHESDDNIKFMAEASTLLLLKEKIKQVDPGRLLGFNF